MIRKYVGIIGVSSVVLLGLSACGQNPMRTLNPEQLLKMYNLTSAKHSDNSNDRDCVDIATGETRYYSKDFLKEVYKQENCENFMKLGAAVASEKLKTTVTAKQFADPVVWKRFVAKYGF